METEVTVMYRCMHWGRGIQVMGSNMEMGFTMLLPLLEPLVYPQR